ncbi:uncharacterized protein Z518_04167 [Rhinocladiella mackenziei CBS 650.93]|uniref:Aldehyde dehydrogenase domain-containing protein n=1 Tax=Rhinocladiella mackenziei CBS 650.93 TaxID=1442369 RepID=A0A0D2H708_9EURO|nr:uncharacterized protein Z518_04167 [Rhinocladiella mackenziei CBS 650.93]KIX06193.1 hypothetical protein Z518_04167 [Rhinocladiella mackenziei CBS 650.93]
MAVQVNGAHISHINGFIPMWLDGREISTSNAFDVISPVTHEVLYQAAAASEDDVDAAIRSCEQAFRSWSKTKPHFRRDIFLRAAQIFAARKDECCQTLRQETGTGKPFFEVTFHQAIEMCKDVAGLIQTIAGQAPIVAEEGKSAIVYREPLGVVLGIAPWNAPFVLGLRACIQPLACGNTVILKGPELSPRTFWLIASVLHEAGLPAGCLNTIYHRPGADAAMITNALISSPVVKKVSFTGSTAVGALIAGLAGKHLKPVLLELGGKAPAIVCENADIVKAAEACALGAFLHSGQICMSTERILVHKQISTAFIEALKRVMEETFGNGKNPPILISQAAVAKNKALVCDAVAKGAQTLYDRDIKSASTTTTGGANGDESNNEMYPVIVGGVRPEMDIYHNESFGPTVSLIEFDNDPEAIEIANDTEYGLTSAVFTKDLQRGLRIARQISAGAVHINGMTVHDETNLPHGGVKKSGFGRNNTLEGLNEWVQTKTVTWMD